MKNFCRGLAFCFCPVGRLYETGLSTAEAGSVPSFSASNESADSWCRHGRHYFIWQRTSILFGNAPRYPLPLLLPHGGSRLGFDGEKADGGLKARAAGTVCLQTRAVARRRFQPFGRRHRNRSGGFCCFSPSKSREKSFLCTFEAKSTKSLRTSFSAGACEPRRCTGRARSGLCATPWRTRRSPPSLFPRQTRVRIGGAANGGIVYFTWQCASEARSSLLFLPASGCVSLLFRKTNHPRNSIFLFPQGDSRLGSDGERADGGLKARAAGTVCLQTRE